MRPDTARSSPLELGEPAPWFRCRTNQNARFAFDTVAGRYIVLCLFGSAADPVAARVLEAVAAQRQRFDDAQLCFFGVSIDPADEREQRVVDRIPGMRFFWDFDRSVSALYGAIAADGRYQPITYLIDPGLRIVASQPFTPDAGDWVAALFGWLDRLPPLRAPFPAPAHAPVLCLPRIFEPALCRALVAYYERHGGRDSGFMRDIDGRTTEVTDYAHKRRRDCLIEDDKLRNACVARLHDRLVPQIHKAFQFQCTRVERHVVACYDAAEQGHFRAHRDNTTKGTAHRRFAVSLFLNSGEYEGGYLRFPEFAPALYSAPLGGAVVFSCSLLHEATAVTAGRRFMYLPFLYDEAGRRLRDENRRFLVANASGHAARDESR